MGNINESDINIEIVLMLRDKLAEIGYEVVLTREGRDGLSESLQWNKDEDMRLRKEMMSTYKCDILISIHQNAYHDTTCKGPQVFYSDVIGDNVEFAEILQDKLNGISPFENKRTSLINNDYFMLKDNTMPSVIVECGFMTNPQELELLLSSEYRMKMTDMIADSVNEFTADMKK